MSIMRHSAHLLRTYEGKTSRRHEVAAQTATTPTPAPKHLPYLLNADSMFRIESRSLSCDRAERGLRVA
jgi:hypothetical protein